MTIGRGFVIAIASGVGFSLFGAMLGLFLGTFFPEYYRLVFSLSPSRAYDFQQLGFGLGLTQGFGAGLVVGVVIVAVVAWFGAATRTRSSAPPKTNAKENPS